MAKEELITTAGFREFSTSFDVANGDDTYILQHREKMID